MSTKEELQRADSTWLAVMCGKVAEGASIDSSTRDRAQELRRKWVRLQRPPSPIYSEEKVIEEQRADLKNRMAEFLASVL